MIYSLEDRQPEIDDSCFVAESADLIGSVVMHENASVWFNCVLRADNEPITVGKNSNVQDGSVLHVDPGFPLNIGEGDGESYQSLVKLRSGASRDRGP